VAELFHADVPRSVRARQVDLDKLPGVGELDRLSRARLVTYFRAGVQRPGLLLAFQWPLDHDPTHLSFGVWLANLMELLDEVDCTLPATVGTDGVART
jgi:hypothetical protein